MEENMLICPNCGGIFEIKIQEINLKNLVADVFIAVKDTFLQQIFGINQKIYQKVRNKNETFYLPPLWKTP